MSRATDAAVGNGAYFTSRREVLSFLNDLLDLDLTKIEQTASGAVACQLTEYLFPGSVPMGKVNWAAKSSFEHLHNYKLLQRAFNKHKIRKHVDVDRLIRGKLRDNLEFCQWLVAFCKRTAPVPAEARDGYDPVAARAKGKGGKDVARRDGAKKVSSRGGPGGGKRAAPARTESAADVLSLPDAALSHAASYLAAPARALFAAAATAPSSSWRRGRVRDPRPSTVSQTILGAGAWDELDFRDVGRDPASRLSDDDVGAALACVDAANGLKTLKLRGCAKVVGECLRLLQGSTVLEHIDLRVGGLSRKVIFPILDSIIDTDGGSLRLVHFPYSWRDIPSPAFDRFLRRYNQHLMNLGTHCSECHELCQDPMKYAGQKYTCYSCTRFICGRYFCLFHSCETRVGDFFVRII